MTLDEIMLLADALADASFNQGLNQTPDFPEKERAALATALKDALNTTPAVPLGVPAGAHTVGEVMELVDAFGKANLFDYMQNERNDLLAAITKLVSDRDVLAASLKETLLFCETFSNRWDGETGVHPFGMVGRARAAIQKVEQK